MEVLARAGRRDHRGGRARGLQLKQQLEQRVREFLGLGEQFGDWFGDWFGDSRRDEGPADGHPA